MILVKWFQEFKRNEIKHWIRKNYYIWKYFVDTCEKKCSWTKEPWGKYSKHTFAKFSRVWVLLKDKFKVYTYIYYMIF